MSVDYVRTSNKNDILGVQLSVLSRMLLCSRSKTLVVGCAYRYPKEFIKTIESYASLLDISNELTTGLEKSRLAINEAVIDAMTINKAVDSLTLFDYGRIIILDRGIMNDALYNQLITRIYGVNP